MPLTHVFMQIKIHQFLESKENHNNKNDLHNRLENAIGLPEAVWEHNLYPDSCSTYLNIQKEIYQNRKINQ